MRSWKILTWSTLGVVFLTAAQYGSVHLLSGRPSSWLFEFSLDLGPPLLFAGDMAQFIFANGSQAALRDQLEAVSLGVLINSVLYGAVALIGTRLFFPSPPLAKENTLRVSRK